MPKILLETSINAPADIVFDLSRSIDLHKLSTAHTNEEAIAGKTSGLISLNESVTWKARHFGVYQTLTSKITALDRPNLFVDEMVSGAFQSFSHEHQFENQNGATIMRDVFEYVSPFGYLGRFADVVFLITYMKRLLVNRNTMIKKFAESDQWKDLLF